MAKFSKGHYEVVSKAISESFDMSHYLDAYEYNGALHAKRMIIDQLVSEFKRDNPMFDEARFLKACAV